MNVGPERNALIDRPLSKDEFLAPESRLFGLTVKGKFGTHEDFGQTIFRLSYRAQ